MDVLRVFEAFTGRDLQVALQVHYMMERHGITAETLRQVLKNVIVFYTGNRMVTVIRAEHAKRRPDEPRSFFGSGLWPPPLKRKDRRAWLQRLSKEQRADYTAWRRASLENIPYGRKKP